MKYNLISERNENYSPMQQILTNRGILAKDIEHYVKTTDKDILPNDLLDNIREGVICVLKHIQNKDRMLVQVDSDCDGHTSSACFINYLYKQFPNYVSEFLDIRIHHGKEHGVIVDTVLNKGYSIVIVADAGSNQYEEHKALKDAGIDVVVIDHHDAEKVSEDAIVINNQLSESYPNKSLSGVGMVYKFCSVMDEMLKTKDADSLLDLVALGMIADMMDMRNFGTRHLITKGLSNIQNPFFKGLVERQAYSLGETVTPIGVAFYIAPLVNATIRVGTAAEKEIMFTAMLNHMAYDQIPSTKRGHKGEMESRIEQAIRNGTNIRNRQKKARDEGIASVEQTILSEKLYDNKVMLIESTSALDKNLTGLVANQLMAKYQKPVLILRRVIDADETTGEVISETLQGSGRGYDKSELSDLRGFLLESEFFNYAEGHANAFGAGISTEKVKAFTDYANEKLANFDFSACYNVDFIYMSNDFKQQDIIDIGSMKSLWGKGIDEAFIVVKGVKVTRNNITLMSADRNPTIKITLPNGVSIIKFGSSREEYESFLTDGYIELDILGTCAINEWQGNISGQILLKEYEIQQQQAYYF